MTDFKAVWALVTAEMARMTWDEKTDLHGDAFYIEALRRVVERSYPASGLVTAEAADKRCHDAERVRDFNATQVEEERRNHIEAVRDGDRREREAHRANAAVYAAALREKAGDVSSRYRREGVLLAAFWLDGKDRP